MWRAPGSALDQSCV
jgi:hypothetical protein